MTERAVGAGIIVALLLITSCRQPPPPPPPAGRNQVRARILTIRTSIPDQKTTLTSRILLFDGKVRLDDELDQWRLFDFRNSTLTTVNEISHTYRTESFETVLARREALISADRPQLPAATFEPTGDEDTILGYPAKRYRIRLGTYIRDLWISDQPLISSRFLAVKLATDRMQPAGAPALRTAWDPLTALQGFPLVDRSEVRYGKTRLVFERKLVSIGTSDVAASWFEIPPGFTEPGGGSTPAQSAR